MSQATFSGEELLKSARFIANFWLLVTMSYLKQHQRPIIDWVQFGAEHVVCGFMTRQNIGALELARIVALNAVSLGGESVVLEGDGRRARATVMYPAEGMLKAFGLSLDDLDLFLSATYEPLAMYLGLQYSSQRVGTTWTWRIARY